MKENSQRTNDNTSKALAHNVGNGKGISITTPLQTKLAIGAINDPLEQEADVMADKGMQMAEPSSQQQTFFNPFTSRINVSPLQTGQGELRRQENEEEKDLEETLPDIQSKFAFDVVPFPPPDDNNGDKNNSSAFIQRKCAACEQEEKEHHIHRKESNSITAEADGGLESYVSNLSSSGSPLSQETKSFFEPKFGYDFSNVRVHTDSLAAKSADSINALAYTSGNNIVFNQNQFSAETDNGKSLLAHELTHVVQQGIRSNLAAVQRRVELRPPGEREASAFGRRQEIVDRLNRLSRAVTYSLLNGDRVLQYQIIEGAEQTNFDRQMIAFIDSASVLPLRLITGRGLVGNRQEGFSTLLVDAFMSAYFDVDDMMAGDDISFQMNMLHILTERSRARNYEARIGSPGLSPIDPATRNPTPEFRRAHQAGIDSETSFLRDIFSDPTIRFVSERPSGDNLIFTFRSAEGYRILHTFRNQSRRTSGGSVVVINAAGETVSVNDFIRQRQEAAAGVVEDLQGL